MSGMENGMETVTLRVNRFTPCPERGRERGGSPFARKSSPFGDSGSTRRRPRGKQWVQDYVVPARPEDTVLDCLLKVKRTIDPTLAFRYSCGHGMCGSDAVSINGTPTLLCTATVKDWAKPAGTAIQTDDEGFRRTDGVDTTAVIRAKTFNPRKRRMPTIWVSSSSHRCPVSPCSVI